MLSGKDGQVACQRTNRDDEDRQFLLDLQIDQSVEEGVNHFAHILHIYCDYEIERVGILTLTYDGKRFWIVIGDESLEFV